jgi:cytochrome c-type biogenesis protein CcmH/NrfF
MAVAMTLLAQDSSSGDILLWSLLLIILVLGLFIVVAVLRKKMSPNEDFHGVGFNLSDLRQMHKKGQMSDEEFQRAKQALLASMNKLPAKPAEQMQPKNLTPP